MGLALYAMAAMYQKASKEPMIRRQIKCRYCRKWINEKVCFGLFETAVFVLCQKWALTGAVLSC